MSIISCHSDTDMSKDRALLINSYKDPLKVSKDTKVGLTSLSFSKKAQFKVQLDINDTFYVRLYSQGVDEFGSQYQVKMTPAIYTGVELATHIQDLLSKHPLSNYIWVVNFDSKRTKFDINVEQVYSSTGVLTCEVLVDSVSGAIEFDNNTTDLVTAQPNVSWTTSTSFGLATPDVMVVSQTNILPDGTNTNGVNDPETGGIWQTHIIPQEDNTSTKIGYGATEIGLTSYWQMNNTDTNTRPVIGGSKSLVMLSIKDDTPGGGTDIELDLTIMKPSLTIDPPNAGWEGTQKPIITSIKPLTNLNSITIDSTPLTNWSTFGYKVDHVYASIEVEQEGKILCHIWHDTGGDGVPTEKRTIAITGENSFDYMLKQVHYPLLGSCAFCSGNIDTPNSVELSGRFSDSSRVNNLSVTAKQISTPLDSTEILDGVQGELKPTLFGKFGDMKQSDGNPGDYLPTGANSHVLLGMPVFYQDVGNPTHSIISDTQGDTVLESPDIHVELNQFNIKSLRSRRKDISRTICILPSEELSSNKASGVIHYSTSQPIMISLNLREDTLISDMTVALKDSSGRLIQDLIDDTNLSLLMSS